MGVYRIIFKITIAIALFTAVGFTFDYFRYVIIPTGEYAYKLDRLTGNVTLLAGKEEHLVTKRFK